MNRSFGTSSFPRARQIAVERKSFGPYFGGTGMVTFSPASSRRCSSHTFSHSACFSSPDGVYRCAARNGTASPLISFPMTAATSASGEPVSSAIALIVAVS